MRLRIEAFALNWGDADLMLDQYSFSFSAFPARVGIEAAGIVDAVGEGVTDVAVGERYCTLPHFYDQRGTSADSVVMDTRFITRAPDGLSAVESASIWMQYMTAYFPIAELAKAGPGINILVPAATSTAGNAALEIGRLRGATMIATTRFEHNRDYLMASGADHVYVSGDGDIVERILEFTNGTGIHASFDPIGGDMMLSYGPALARDSILFFYGGLSGEWPQLPLLHMLQNNSWLHPYSLGNYVADPESCARGRAFVYGALERGEIAPRIDRVYPMDAYIDAWRYLRTDRREHGKVVIETGA